MSHSEQEGRREAKSFAEETAFVLLWELNRRKRAARRHNDFKRVSRIDAIIDRIKTQRRVMRKIVSAPVIRACADEWQATLGAIDILV